MAVQIVSDLHLETPKAYDIFEIEPKAPVLALLGDIGNIVLHKEDCPRLPHKTACQVSRCSVRAGEPRGVPLRLAEDAGHASRL